MLSIIIPTLNEEKYLPVLLESIKRQGFSDCEIVVADAGSTDKTREIAEKYDCRVVKGGLPAKGKNEGAKAAKGNLLLFLDADVILPEQFFEKIIAEFKKREVHIASFCILPDVENKFYHVLFNLFYNFPMILWEKILPHSATGILVDAETFKKLNGFDETITLAEDHDLSRRAKKNGKAYGVLRSSKIFVSDRRFREEGWVKVAGKYLLCELHMIFKGPVRSDFFNYKYDHYSKDKENKV